MLKPEPGPKWQARARHLFFKPDLARKPNLPYESGMRNCGVSKTECAGVVAGTRFYHTPNSNQLEQNISLNKHKLSVLVNANTAECIVS